MNRYFSTALGTLTTASALTMGLAMAPAANASCVSAFGFGNSSHCNSGPTTIAIAIGASAEAHANGVLGSAVALGNGSVARTYDWFGFAAAVGTTSYAIASGNLAMAVAAGWSSIAEAGAAYEPGNIAIDLGTSNVEAYGGSGNIAVNLFGNGAHVISLGTGNVAVNTGNQSQVWAFGKLSNASNLGDASLVTTSSGGVACVAFNVLGANNIVQTGNGPLALAASIFQTSAVIHKSGPGFNINGIVAGGAAATQPVAKHTAAKGLAGSKRKHA